jgi:hypothetical protein
MKYATITLIYIMNALPVYHMRICQRKKGGMNGTQIFCVGRNLVVEDSALLVSEKRQLS